MRMKNIATLLILGVLFNGVNAQNVGIGEDNPASKMAINGNFSVGAGYGTIAAPADGAIIKGNVGIGNSNPASLFAVGPASQFQVNSAGAIAAATGITSSGAIKFSSLGNGFVKTINGDGTVASAALQASDIPDMAAVYIRNQTALQANSNFHISGNGVVGGTLKVGNYTLPTSDGAAGYSLTTDGAGNLTWGRSGTGAIDAYMVSSTIHNAPTFTYSAGSDFSNTTDVTIPNTVSTVDRTISVSGVSRPIARVVVSDLDITHGDIGQLTVSLISPAGTEVILTQNTGGNGNNFSNVIFDDFSTTALPAGNAALSGTYKPYGQLSKFAGESSNGTWTLRVKDNTAGSGGTITNAQITIYAESSGAYTFVAEVAVPVTSGEITYIDGTYSAMVSNTAMGLKITRATTSGSGTVGDIVGYGATETSGNKYHHVSIKAANAGLPTATYYYKLWVSGGTISQATDNYNLLVTKSH